MTDALDIARNIDEAACLDILSDMVRHKSYSETPGERVLADHLVMVMRDMSLEAELGVVEGERMNAIGRLRGSGGGKSLLFNGHIDTNPVSEGWTVDPWGGCYEGPVLLLSRAPDLRDLSGGPVGAPWFYRPPTKSCRG